MKSLEAMSHSPTPQKPTEVKEKRVKAGPFYSSTTQRTSRTLEKRNKKKGKAAYQWRKLSPEKEPPRSTRIAEAKIPLNEQDSEKVEKEKTQGTENFLKKTKVCENK